MSNGKDWDPFKDGLPAKEPAPKDPTPEEKAEAALAEERKLREEAEARREEAERKANEQHQYYEGRLDQLSNYLKSAYDEKTRQQDPEPDTDITDADFDKSPSAATDAKIDRKMKETLGKVNEYYAGVIGNMNEQLFESQMQNISNKRFYKYVEPEIRKFFEENPQAKMSPRAAETIYAQFTGGDKIDDLLAQEAEEKAREALRDGEPPAPRTRPARVIDSPRTPAPRVPSRTTPSSPALPEDEQEMFEIYSKYGIFENEEDWNNWKKTIGLHSRQDIPTNLRETE